MPSNALKAGSSLPPLARKTALTTAASIAGNASFKVVSACCSGANGRGGFGGATSSPEPGCTVDVAAADLKGDAVGSTASSSKSKALAVVGDSGRGAIFCVTFSRPRYGLSPSRSVYILTSLHQTL